MRLSFGADERNPVVDQVLQYLKKQSYEVVWYGPEGNGTVPWPEVARNVAEDVDLSRSDEGILLYWTGTGVSIAANKVQGIRAALCVDADTARDACLWNNANVLCLSVRLASEAVALEIIKTWFKQDISPTRLMMTVLHS